MSTIEQPTNALIRELSRAEIDTILTRNNVGRIAFSFHDRVDIEPIHYVYQNGWIYGRTSKGSKLDAIAHHTWVAFEVDEVVAIFDWRSVVVKGGFYAMGAQTPPHPDPNDTSVREDPAFTQGVALLRSLILYTLLSADPAPFRHIVFRIHVDEVRGAKLNQPLHQRTRRECDNAGNNEIAPFRNSNVLFTRLQLLIPRLLRNRTREARAGHGREATHRYGSGACRRSR